MGFPFRVKWVFGMRLSSRLTKTGTVRPASSPATLRVRLGFVRDCFGVPSRNANLLITAGLRVGGAGPALGSFCRGRFTAASFYRRQDRR